MQYWGERGATLAIFAFVFVGLLTDCLRLIVVSAVVLHFDCSWLHSGKYLVLSCLIIGVYVNGDRLIDMAVYGAERRVTTHGDIFVAVHPFSLASSPT